jgi:hypothetical protein
MIELNNRVATAREMETGTKCRSIYVQKIQMVGEGGSALIPTDTRTIIIDT